MGYIITAIDCLLAFLEKREERTFLLHVARYGLRDEPGARAFVMAGEPVLTEHAAVEWRNADQLAELDWAPADIPAVKIVAASAGEATFLNRV